MNITQSMWAELNGVWTDITSVTLLGTIYVNDGMGNKQLDRVAGTGYMTFDVNNSSGAYSPGNVGTLSGWDVGIRVKWVVTCEGQNFIKFQGKISSDPQNPGLKVDPGVSSTRRVHVRVLDWMDRAAKTKMAGTGIQTNKRADQVLELIVDAMPSPPARKNFDTGTITFPYAFDTIQNQGTVYAEAAKLILSELGYLYIEHDNVYGETLRFEANDARGGSRAATTIPKSSVNSGYLLKEDGTYWLNETGGKIILNQTETPSFTDSMSASDVTYGTNLINHVTVYAYPKSSDTSDQVLYSLAIPEIINSGQTITIRSNYVDPTGGGRMVNVDTTTMITPVKATDYAMRANSDGTGTNLDDYLTVTANYGTEGVTYTLRNTGTVVGWVTLLKARGRGFYIDSPSQHVESDSASITDYDTQALIIHQKYNRTTKQGTQEARKILQAEKAPRKILNWVKMSANRSDTNMYAFLRLGIGDLVTISETQSGVSGKYYITGREYFGLDGNMIDFAWKVKDVPPTFDDRLVPLSVQFTGSSTTSLVSYDAIPELWNLPAKSVSFWVYLNSYPINPFPFGFVNMALGDGQGGWRISAISDKSIWYEQFGSADFHTNTNTITSGGWRHIVVTRDTTYDVDAYPILYYNGSSVGLTKGGTGTTLVNETGACLYIGNLHGYNSSSTDGKIFDVRIYNRVITAAEVTTIYNSGTPSATVGTTDGLKFQAFAVHSYESSSYIDQALNGSTPLVENILGREGLPADVTGRAAP